MTTKHIANSVSEMQGHFYRKGYGAALAHTQELMMRHYARIMAGKLEQAFDPSLIQPCVIDAETHLVIAQLLAEAGNRIQNPDDLLLPDQNIFDKLKADREKSVSEEIEQDRYALSQFIEKAPSLANFLAWLIQSCDEKLADESASALIEMANDQKLWGVLRAFGRLATKLRYYETERDTIGEIVSEALQGLPEAALDPGERVAGFIRRLSGKLETLEQSALRDAEGARLFGELTDYMHAELWNQPENNLNASLIERFRKYVDRLKVETLEQSAIRDTSVADNWGTVADYMNRQLQGEPENTLDEPLTIRFAEYVARLQTQCSNHQSSQESSGE